MAGITIKPTPALPSLDTSAQAKPQDDRVSGAEAINLVNKIQENQAKGWTSGDDYWQDDSQEQLKRLEIQPSAEAQAVW